MKYECSNCYKFKPVCSAYGLCNGELINVKSPSYCCKEFISIELYNAVKCLLENKGNINFYTIQTGL